MKITAFVNFENLQQKIQLTEKQKVTDEIKKIQKYMTAKKLKFPKGQDQIFLSRKQNLQDRCHQ